MREATPPNLGGAIKWVPEAEQARREPGKWFEISDRPSEISAWSFAEQIRNGRKAAFRPARSFDAMARGTKVFVSFKGETA